MEREGTGLQGCRNDLAPVATNWSRTTSQSQTRPGDEIYRQCPPGTQGERPCAAHRTEPRPHGSSCATHGCAVFGGASPGEPGQRKLPSTPRSCYREGTKHHQAARPGKGDTDGQGGTKRLSPASPCLWGARATQAAQTQRSLPPPPQLHCPCSLFCARAKTQCYFCS